jgi:uncharacterized phiE125 gp8 family phage protein
MSVPLSTIKSSLKIEYDDDDTELTRLRDAASTLIERETGLVLTPSTRTIYLASFKDTTVPYVPFTSISQITYYNGSNAYTVMPATQWWVDLSDGPLPVLRFLEQPAVYEGTNVTIAVSCGYAALPNDLVQAVVALTGGWYSNPEGWQPINLSMVPMNLEYIISALRVRELMR